MPGTLYVVATPIGNLEDITYRAVRVLGEVDLIACEDTRQTRKLLDHYAIDRPTISYHEHNERSRAEELIGELEGGRSIALVTDAGTPLVSDPGYRLVRGAVERAIPVVALPGASALMTALAASGMPTDAFFFAGFLPPKDGQRRKALERLRDIEATLVLYEAPHRILETLDDIASILGHRQVALARELTKLHEELLRGSVSEVREQLAARQAIKGEITLVIARASGAAERDERPLAEQVRALESAGLPRMDAIKEIARRNGLGKRQVYQALESSD